MGGVSFGLSFIKVPSVGLDAPDPLSPASRIANVFFDPESVFKNLRFYPRWVAAFVVLSFCTVAYQVAYVQRIGAERIAEEQVEKILEMGFIQGEAAARLKQQTLEAAKQPAAKLAAPISAVLGTLLFMYIAAAIYFLMAMIFGGRFNYWQAVSVVAYSWLPVLVITNLLSLAILFMKSVDDIDPVKGQRGLVHADLSVLINGSEHPVLWALATSVGVFSIYGLWLTATGLRNAGEKLSSSSAWTIAVILWLVVVLLGAGAAYLFPGWVG
jgi:hypothetical protein